MYCFVTVYWGYFRKSPRILVTFTRVFIELFNGCFTAKLYRYVSIKCSFDLSVIEWRFCPSKFSPNCGWTLTSLFSLYLFNLRELPRKNVELQETQFYIIIYIICTKLFDTYDAYASNWQILNAQMRLSHSYSGDWIKLQCFE